MDADLISLSVGIVGTAITIVSFLLGIVAYRDNVRLKKESKTISWDDTLLAIDSISEKMKRDSYVPDVIFSPDSKGGILGELLALKFEKKIPVIVGICLFANTNCNIDFFTKWPHIESSRWKMYIPHMDEIGDVSELRLLIVDDKTFSGESIGQLRTKFLELGFDLTNIKVFTLAATGMAEINRANIDYFFKSFESHDFYLPWGKAD